MGRFHKLTFTPAVKSAQERLGSRRSYARLEQSEDVPDELGEAEASFIAARDSFYLASVGSEGWPYIQHRGGPAGFLQVLDPHTLAFPDYRGNRQYISVGNNATDDRVALFLMDYPERTRLKILARARIITRESDAELFERITRAAPAERVWLLSIEGFDWNCPQHITPRYTEAEIAELLQPTLTQLQQLQTENATLRAELARRDAGTPPKLV